MGDTVTPKRADRFIHARYLADGATPPYDSDASYREHVVTSVKATGPVTLVFHTTAQAWDAGNPRASWYFRLDRESEHVRRWL